MPLKTLIGPIAAATIVNVFLFALAWRGHQIEMRTGKDPWWLGVGLGVYGLTAAAFAYLRADLTSSSGFDLFGIALASEGLGVVITYALLQAFVLSRGRPWSERATPIVLSLVLAGGMLAAILTT